MDLVANNHLFYVSLATSAVFVLSVYPPSKHSKEIYIGPLLARQGSW